MHGARRCWEVSTCQAAPENSAARRHFPRLPDSWSLIAVEEGFPLLHTGPQPLGRLLEVPRQPDWGSFGKQALLDSLTVKSWWLMLPLAVVGLWNKANYLSLKGSTHWCVFQLKLNCGFSKALLFSHIWGCSVCLFCWALVFLVPVGLSLRPDVNSSFCSWLSTHWPSSLVHKGLLLGFVFFSFLFQLGNIFLLKEAARGYHNFYSSAVTLAVL